MTTNTDTRPRIPAGLTVTPIIKPEPVAFKGKLGFTGTVSLNGLWRVTRDDTGATVGHIRRVLATRKRQISKGVADQWESPAWQFTFATNELKSINSSLAAWREAPNRAAALNMLADEVIA